MIDIKFGMSPELKQKLRLLRSLLEGDESNAPLILIGNEVANEAKRLVAVKTGTLRRSIRVEVKGPGRVTVGTDVAYGPRQEFGFHGTDSRGRSYHFAGKPYMRPAMAAVSPKARQIMHKATMDLLRKALG